jgi:polyphosphate kinase
MGDYSFFSRDLSWLSFNERVLTEARRKEVPLLEQIRFLSIFSSNLDEFYRVRMPVLRAIRNDASVDPALCVYEQAKKVIDRQQETYGQIVRNVILPGLLQLNYDWLYHKPIPESLSDSLIHIFRSEIREHLVPVAIDLDNKTFFARNNTLYQGVFIRNAEGQEKLFFLDIPVDKLSRLFKVTADGVNYIIFLEDIVRHNLGELFPGEEILAAYNIKVTRDAELRVEDEVDEDVISAMQKELAKRDYGPATRFLCQPDIPLRRIYQMVYVLNLQQASIVTGGFYHNLRDLSNFPVKDERLEYPKWPALALERGNAHTNIFERIKASDILVNVPYQSFDPVLAFFKAAETDPAVTSVYCTLYRVANPSQIVESLTNASKNGKKVIVMLELKARFDEANNIKWAMQLKAAGAKTIYSSSAFKVHAKVALVKRLRDGKQEYFGLLSTGNLNETTARFYTDHFLLTSHEPMLKELEILFTFLGKKRKSPGLEDHIRFKHLLVAQFNLQSKFLSLINREIEHAKAGLHASITIKLNNLEEKTLISKLYDASNAGVKIQLIVRSICCLVPGIEGQSENITVKRIVDRYLEHGRIFLFHNRGEEELFMGSSDWMNRNMYSRIEVCFPIYDAGLSSCLKQLLKLQWEDTTQAVQINSRLENVPLENSGQPGSQQQIYSFLKEAAINPNNDALNEPS